MKYLLPLLILFVLIPNAYAQWVWRSDTGWTNTRYTQKEKPEKLIKLAKKLKKEGLILESIRVYQSIIEKYSYAPEAEEAMFLAAETAFKDKRYYLAYQYYKKYSQVYSYTSKRTQISKRMYSIGFNITSEKEQRGPEIDPEKGVDVLERVIELTPNAKFADDAQLTIGNYYFKQQMYQEAQKAYEKLLDKGKYPETEWRPRVMFLIALSLQRQFRGLSYNGAPLKKAEQKIQEYIKEMEKIIVTLSERNKNIQEYILEVEESLQEDTEEEKEEEFFEENTKEITAKEKKQTIKRAQEEQKRIKKIILKETQNIEQAHKKKAEIREILAQKELMIARYYIQQGNNHSARIYLQYIVNHYSKTKTAPRAKLLLNSIIKTK